jgi:hypothetical protein
MLAHCDILIGATGTNAMTYEDMKHLRDGTILASASSGDLEFASLAHWPMTQSPLLLGPGAPSVFDRTHGLIIAHGPKGQAIHIVNGGFPVNFTGDVDPIQLPHIVATRALMLGAYLQAGQVASAMVRGVWQSGEIALEPDIDDYVRAEA